MLWKESKPLELKLLFALGGFLPSSGCSACALAQGLCPVGWRQTESWGGGWTGPLLILGKPTQRGRLTEQPTAELRNPRLMGTRLWEGLEGRTWLLILLYRLTMLTSTLWCIMIVKQLTEKTSCCICMHIFQMWSNWYSEFSSLMRIPWSNGLPL